MKSEGNSCKLLEYHGGVPKNKRCFGGGEIDLPKTCSSLELNPLVFRWSTFSKVSRCLIQENDNFSPSFPRKPLLLQ